MKIVTEPVVVVVSGAASRTYRATVESGGHESDHVTIEAFHDGVWYRVGSALYDEGIRGCDAVISDAVLEILEAAIVRALIANIGKG